MGLYLGSVYESYYFGVIVGRGFLNQVPTLLTRQAPTSGLKVQWFDKNLIPPPTILKTQNGNPKHLKFRTARPLNSSTQVKPAIHEGLRLVTYTMETTQERSFLLPPALLPVAGFRIRVWGCIKSSPKLATTMRATKAMSTEDKAEEGSRKNNGTGAQVIEQIEFLLSFWLKPGVKFLG